MLRDHRAHQETAVRSAAQREVRRVGVFLPYQGLGRRREIVEDILLSREIAAHVPAFAVVRAAADAGLGVHAARVEPGAYVHTGEIRLRADAEAAIAVQQRWVFAVERRAFLAHDIDRYPGTVPGHCEDADDLGIVEPGETGFREPGLLGFVIA